MRRYFRKHGGVLDGEELDGDGAPGGGGGPRSGNAYPPELDGDIEKGTPESEEWSRDER
jgi:hypothetical protein